MTLTFLDQPYDAFTAPLALPSVARDALAILHIEAELCPHVVRRAIETVAVQNHIAFTILIRRESRIQIIEMELAIGFERAATTLLQTIRRIAMERRAFIETPEMRAGACDVVARKA